MDFKNGAKKVQSNKDSEDTIYEKTEALIPILSELLPHKSISAFFGGEELIVVFQSRCPSLMELYAKKGMTIPMIGLKSKKIEPIKQNNVVTFLKG